MEENENSLLAILKRDPEQTSLIVKVGVVVPVAIIMWQLVAVLLLPLFAVVPVTVALIVFYGVLLVLLTVRLTHASFLWQSGSTRTASRLAAAAVRPPTQEPMLLADAVAAIKEAQASSLKGRFNEEYFLLRLQEEVQSARRDGQKLSVAVMHIAVADDHQKPDLLEKLAVDVARLASSQAKQLRLVSQTAETEFCLALPENDRQEAKSFMGRLVRALGDFWCHYGLAIYPENGTKAEDLLEAARNSCDESRFGHNGDAAGHEKNHLLAQVGSLIHR